MKWTLHNGRWEIPGQKAKNQPNSHIYWPYVNVIEPIWCIRGECPRQSRGQQTVNWCRKVQTIDYTVCEPGTSMVTTAMNVHTAHTGSLCTKRPDLPKEERMRCNVLHTTPLYIEI